MAEAGDAMLGVVLRPFSGGDRTFALHLFIACKSTEFQARGWAPDQARLAMRTQFALRQQAFGEAGLRDFILERDGAPIGRLLLDDSRDPIRIVEISLLPYWQRRGIGTSLVRAVLAHARAKDMATTLTVAVRSPLRLVCERMGFQQVHDDGAYVELAA